MVYHSIVIETRKSIKERIFWNFNFISDIFGAKFKLFLDILKRRQSGHFQPELYTLQPKSHFGSSRVQKLAIRLMQINWDTSEHFVLVRSDCMKYGKRKTKNHESFVKLVYLHLKTAVLRRYVFCMHSIFKPESHLTN